MTTYIITRHTASRNWILNNLPDTNDTPEIISHLDPQVIQSGDTVIGVLPLQIIAEITRKGANFYSFEINVPADLRGIELTEEHLKALSPKLIQYEVHKIGE